MNFFRPSRRILSHSIAASLATVLLWPGGATRAADSIWSTPNSGTWNNGLNWATGIFPNEIDTIADFSTQDLTAALTISLGGSFTVGGLRFGDASLAAIFNTTLAPGSPAGTLTLATSSNSPTIGVTNGIAVISAKLAGTQGFTLTNGTLRLTGTANTISGGIRLGAGSELQFAANSLNGNLVDFTENATLTWQGNHSQDLSEFIKIEDGKTATLATGTGNVTFAKALQAGTNASVTKTGTGTLTFNAANTYSGLTKINQGRLVLAGSVDPDTQLPRVNLLNVAGTIALGQGTNSGILQLGNAGGALDQTTTSLTIVGTGTANAVVGGHTNVSTLTINNAAAVAFAGFLGGAGANENNLAITKSGAGALTLSNTGNTFTGPVTLNQGTLTFSNGSLGNSGLITFAGTSSLSWATGNTQDVFSRIKINDGVIATFSLSSNTLTLASTLGTGPLKTGALTKGDSGTLIITAAQIYTGATRVNNGRIVLKGNNLLSAGSLIQFGNAANSGTLQLGDTIAASNQTVSGLAITGNASSVANAIVGGYLTNSILTVDNATSIAATNSPIFGGNGTNENNLALVKLGAGSLALSKANTFAGNVDLNGGAIIVNNSSSLGVGPKTITIKGATDAPSLQLSNSSGVVLAGNINFVTSNDDATAAAIVNVAGQNIVGGNISLASGGYGGGHTRILASGGNLTLNGVISADAAAASNRTLILDGAASGIADGIIQDNGSIRVAVTKEGTGTWSLNAANTYTGDTLVNGGRLNLTTAQTGAGSITIADGATLGVTLTAGGQSLAASTLVLNHSNAGSALAFDLGSFSNPTASLITTGTFSTSGIGANVIDISGLNLSVGTFDLIRYTGTIGGDGYAGLALGTTPARVTANLVNGTGKVQLAITAFDVPKWTGAVDGLWDINDDPDPSVGSGTPNWKEAHSGNETRYLQIGSIVDSVIFDDTATGTTDIELTTSLSPTTITVNNSTLTYTFGGSGKLTGQTSVLKTGSGLLILVNTGGNDYSGTTTINGGTIQVGDGINSDAGEIGTGEISIGATGSLVLNRPAGFAQDLTLLNVISGSGTLIQKGTNTVTLGGNSSEFDGSIEVVSGILKVGSANALGTLVGATQIDAGAILDITGFSLAEALQLNGGTIRIVSGSNTLGGNITLTGGGTIDNAAGTLTITGAISGSGGLKKNNAGILTLPTASSFGGGFTINGGTVILSSNQNYTGGTVVAGGAILQLGAAAGATAGNVGAGDIALNATTGIATLNILRSDAFEIANNITSSGSNATNALTIGVTGAGSASGTVTLSGANTFTGDITINGGAIRITNGSALGVGPKNVRIASNAGPALKLDGSLGNVTLAADINFQISSDGTIANAAANAGALVNVAGDNIIGGRISQINGGGGNGRITVLAGSLTINGNIDAEGATGVRTLQLGGGATGTVNGVISDDNSNVSAASVVSVTKDGTGVWTLNGPNRFTGALAVQNGTLRFGSAAASGVAQPLGASISAITIGTATTTGTLEFNGASDTILGRPITVNGVGGGILKNSGGALLTLSGVITRAARPLTFTGGAFNVTGQITGASANLNIDGATVTLSQPTNNYVGPTVVSNGGVLKNGAADVLPDATTVTLGNATTNTGGTYDLNGFNETVAGLSGVGSGTKIVTNRAAAGIATLNLSGTSDFAGVIQDGATAVVAITKSTGGTFTASGANTYTGATNVNGGTLLVAGSLSGTSTVAVANGGTLGGSGSIATGAGGNITVAEGGSLAPGLNAPGTLTLSLGIGQLDTSAVTTGTGWLRFELGIASDRIVLASGGLNLGASFDLDDFSFVNTGSFGQGTYVLFETNSAIAATFGPNVTGTLFGFEVSLELADGGTDLVLQVVPEPSAAINLLGGLTTLLGLQRFRRSSRRRTADHFSNISAS